MNLRASHFLLLLLFACGGDVDNKTTTSDTTESDTTDASDASDNVNDDGETCVEGEAAQWGAIRCEPAEAFFADDLSQAVRDGINQGLMHAANVWGNYGPLEYWVMGTDDEAGLTLIDTFCERREARGDWDKASVCNTTPEKMANTIY